ncbi:MAG: hypothetical protein SF029_26865 [bacterium]|nr:hypothetical protein [bacterium]
MKRILIVLTLVMLVMTVSIGSAAAQNSDGTLSVECTDGSSFNNGMEISVVQMRSGFTYTATVLGLNGFDPVLAVIDNSNEGLCTDDSVEIADYTASLPSTGDVDGQSLNAQIRFDNGGDGFNDVRLVVGGYGNSAGEFLLLLEGMAVTDADGQGDPFSVLISEPMIESGIPVTAYAISVTGELDPLVALVDGDREYIEDDNGNLVACDDAGSTDLCWGDSEALNDSFVPRANGDLLGGFQYDSMLSLPLNEDMAGMYFNFVVSSYNQSTYGDYVMAFHIGIGESAGGSNK